MADLRHIPAFLALALGLAIAGLFHLRLGASPLSWAEVWGAVTAWQPENPAHNIVIEMRLPRLLSALTVGAALGLAGALMQGLTGNPLAEPGLLGINSGAAFFVVTGLLLVPGSTLSMLPWLAIAGAICAALCVVLNAGRAVGSARLILAGVMTGALFSALTIGILILDQQGIETLRRWLTGSLAFESAGMRQMVTPFILLAAVIAVANIPALNLFRLGDQAAGLMGLNVARFRLTLLLAIVLLAGASVATAGPIGFVGLVAPHLARLIFGTDYRLLLPAATLIGAGLLVLGDILARLAVRPLELNTGIVTAIIGAPVFIFLVVRRVK
ncbi:iron ABC transporter permease [Xinfangfangia sp. D13-10-4-6]|uniref:FecCD family ABC transporter permease n=1 Tax=Pseudogemmobacter hezensis TaxID=2737662 RepID=UPI0015548295|nr:iron ABC transporter permease [Pseudogemmobacter hezensis]NPD16332.1 iron ABC transporter permease [Pseudogemmobacter hezensis]